MREKRATSSKNNSEGKIFSLRGTQQARDVKFAIPQTRCGFLEWRIPQRDLSNKYAPSLHRYRYFYHISSNISPTYTFFFLPLAFLISKNKSTTSANNVDTNMYVTFVRWMGNITLFNDYFETDEIIQQNSIIFPFVQDPIKGSFLN